MESRIVLILVFIFILSISINTQAQNKITDLEEKIRDQEERIKELERELNILEKGQDDKTYADTIIKSYTQSAQAQEKMTPTAGYDNGFFIRSEDGNIEFKFNGWIITQALFHEDDTTSNDTFQIRSSRLRFQTYFYKNWHVCVDITAECLDGDILGDAYVEYIGWQYLQIRAGQIKPPFSVETQESTDDLPAMYYSPIVKATAEFGVPHPGDKDLGILIYGYAFDYIGYAVAITNGNGRNALDENDDKHFFAQFRFYPFKTENKRTFFHVAAMMGREGIRPEGADLATPWGVEVFDSVEKNGRSVAPAVDGFIINTDPDSTCGWVYGVSVGFRHYRKDSPIRAGGEFIYKQLARDRVSVTSPDGTVFSRRASRIHLWGFWLQFGYFFQIGEDTNSGVEPFARVSYADVDDGSSEYPNAKVSQGIGHALDIRGQTLWDYTVGIKWYMNKHIRFEFDWMISVPEHTEHIGPNDGTSTITDKIDHSGGVMHAFALQLVAKW